MFEKTLSTDDFKRLRGNGRLNLAYTGNSAVLGREYVIKDPRWTDEPEDLYAKCVSEHPFILELIDKPENPVVQGLSKTDLIILSEKTGNQYVEVKDGEMSNVRTGEVIPLEHLLRKEMPIDGLYRLSEATCSGSMTNGKGGSFKETPENMEKYQCRVGRHAPLCNMYSPTKCAGYSVERPEQYTISFSPTDLIAILKQQA